MRSHDRTALGTVRFRRAIEARSVLLAELTAREMRHLDARARARARESLRDRRRQEVRAGGVQVAADSWLSGMISRSQTCSSQRRH